jgi:hypothetical protein
MKLPTTQKKSQRFPARTPETTMRRLALAGVDD